MTSVWWKPLFSKKWINVDRSFCNFEAIFDHETSMHTYVHTICVLYISNFSICGVISEFSTFVIYRKKILWLKAFSQDKKAKPLLNHKYSQLNISDDMRPCGANFKLKKLQFLTCFGISQSSLASTKRKWSPQPPLQKKLVLPGFPYW